jgi:hypothetical protein
MEKQSLTSQPETAWYKRRLQNKRRFRFVAGIVFLGLVLFFFIGELIQNPFHDIISLLVFVVLSLLLIWFAVSEILINRGPVPLEDINQLRQHERSLLFRQAQGVLPWQYHLWARILESLLAVFCFYFAASKTVLVASGQSEWLLGCIYLFAGLLLLVDAFYLKPGRAMLLASRSAAELSSRLKIGEATGNSHSDQDA